MNDTLESTEFGYGIHLSEDEIGYLTFFVGEQMFGLPVLVVRDILKTPKLTRVPLASSHVRGVLNLRGKIITAINVRQCLGHSEPSPGNSSISIVVENQDEMYNLLVDRVGDVIWLTDDSFETTPQNLDPKWANLCPNLHRLDGSILLIMEIERLLEFDA